MKKHIKQEQPEQGKPVRAPRSDKGQRRLIERDLDILRLIGEQYAYRFDQLQGLLARHPQTHSADPTFLSETRTREAIKKWKQLGLVDSRKILHEDSAWVWLTRKGLSQVGLSVHFLEPRAADLSHVLWVNDIRALVEDEEGSLPGFVWESERLMRVKREYYQLEKKKDQHLLVPFEYRGKHRPDALLRYREDEDKREHVTAIEVELSQKSYENWKKIFQELSIYYSNARYYVSDELRPALSKALKRFQEETPKYGEPETEQRQYIYIHRLREVL